MNAHRMASDVNETWTLRFDNLNIRMKILWYYIKLFQLFLLVKTMVKIILTSFYFNYNIFQSLVLSYDILSYTWINLIERPFLGRKSLI